MFKVGDEVLLKNHGERGIIKSMSHDIWERKTLYFISVCNGFPNFEESCWEEEMIKIPKVCKGEFDPPCGEPDNSKEYDILFKYINHLRKTERV